MKKLTSFAKPFSGNTSIAALAKKDTLVVWVIFILLALMLMTV